MNAKLCGASLNFLRKHGTVLLLKLDVLYEDAKLLQQHCFFNIERVRHQENLGYFSIWRLHDDGAVFDYMEVLARII